MTRLSALAALAVLIAVGGCAGLREAEPDCAQPAAYAKAAAYNAAAEKNLAFTPFGRTEQGWAIYAPRIGRTVRSICPADSPGFARAVARFQTHANLPPHGGVDETTFQAMKADWQQARPFVRLRAQNICPAPPDETSLAPIPAAFAWRGAEVRLRPRALAALERMIAAARADVPAIAADPQVLTVFSGYRSPAYDAARCAHEANCDGVVRATCSAHRTGLAVDLNLGAAPGYVVDSSADANRLYQTGTPAYRWLLANAARFGFVNYPFEPWHWEWTGEAP